MNQGTIVCYMIVKKAGLPKPKFERGDVITDGEITIVIDFRQYDYEKEEFYYFPKKYEFSRSIYESDVELTDPPKSFSVETMEILRGKKAE